MRSLLADFAEALATFSAHPTPETFRVVQLAGRRLDDARRTASANHRDVFGGRLPIPSIEGSVR
jgi:hypothetical protein